MFRAAGRLAGAAFWHRVMVQGKNKHKVKCPKGRVILLKQELEAVSGVAVSAQKLICLAAPEDLLGRSFFGT